MSRTRPPIERARAALRLAADGEPVPVAELRSLCGASTYGIVRWIKEGRSGVYLDGVRDPKLGWMSTRQAVMRFLKEVGERKAAGA